MLDLVATGEHHRHADALNEKLITGLNAILERESVSGAAYGLASYFHITLGAGCPRPTSGIEWPGPDLPPRLDPSLNAALKRAMNNHGADLMGGSGGFVSGVHTEADIDLTLAAFEASVREMRTEGLA
jgi:glutamate-1-semialdehyde 2,1-aminomutase